MENIRLSATSRGLHVEGFPEAVKVIALDGPIARRLADLSLHNEDLRFAKACLGELAGHHPDRSPTVQRALWRSAIIYLVKCFGLGERFSLQPDQVFKGEAQEVLRAFGHFKGLRNKHIVHDENSFAQGMPGAILNDRREAKKIEKIVCSVVIVETFNQANLANLNTLVDKAGAWVTATFDALADDATATLEAAPYDALLARKTLTFTAPTVEELSKRRGA